MVKLMLGLRYATLLQMYNKLKKPDCELYSHGHGFLPQCFLRVFGMSTGDPRLLLDILDSSHIEASSYQC